jgi:hypothetical protein
MTETRRNKPQPIQELIRETLDEIDRLKSEGVVADEEIAVALNRSGFPDPRGRQWTTQSLMTFMTDPDVEFERLLATKRRK